jgi:hypothetical protein
MQLGSFRFVEVVVGTDRHTFKGVPSGTFRGSSSTTRPFSA